MPHDPETLFAARYAIRDAYTRITRLRQTSEIIPEMLGHLDQLCVRLTEELAAIEPEMQLRSVMVIPIASGPVEHV